MKTSERSDHAASTQGPSMPRRDRIAVGFFGTWMLTGLFLDGWAHERNKPETFFSPWHGVLYSGFAVAVAFFFLAGLLDRRRGVSRPPDRLAAAGLGLFVAGALGDGVWHQLFGIEVDLEALLSPTHLSLMIGGLMMLGAPIRTAWTEPGTRPGFRSFLPVAVPVTLALALLSFFLLYLSAFHIDPGAYRQNWLAEIHGVGSILATNALLLGATMFVLIRWTPPAGAFALMFTGMALFMSGIHAFEQVAIVAAAAVGGMAADGVCRLWSARPRRSVARLAGLVVPLALWGTWFAVYEAAWGVGWAVELWVGSIVLSMLSGVGLSLLAFPPAGALRDA